MVGTEKSDAITDKLILSFCSMLFDLNYVSEIARRVPAIYCWLSSKYLLWIVEVRVVFGFNDQFSAQSTFLIHYGHSSIASQMFFFGHNGFPSCPASPDRK